MNMQLERLEPARCRNPPDPGEDGRGLSSRCAPRSSRTAITSRSSRKPSPRTPGNSLRTSRFTWSQDRARSVGKVDGHGRLRHDRRGVPPPRPSLEDRARRSRHGESRARRRVARLSEAGSPRGRGETRIGGVRPRREGGRLSFSANRGPVVRVEVHGASIDPERVKRLIPIFQEGSVDEDLLNEGNRRLRDYYQGRGYFDARVAHERQSVGRSTEVTILYTVQLGPRRRMEQVSIAGKPLLLHGHAHGSAQRSCRRRSRPSRRL